MAATKRYELSEDEWNRISALIPEKQRGTKGRPTTDNRTAFNGVIWLARSGAPWRDLPERYGSWETVYTKFRKWLDDGVIDNIFRILSLEADPSELIMDSTIIRAHQASAGAKKGAKRHKSVGAAEG